MSNPEDESDTTVTSCAEEVRACLESASSSPDGPSVAFPNGLQEDDQRPRPVPAQGTTGISGLFVEHGERELPPVPVTTNDPEAIMETLWDAGDTSGSEAGAGFLAEAETASEQSLDPPQVQRTSTRRSAKQPRWMTRTASAIPADTLTEVSSISSVPTPDITSTWDTTPDISTPLDASVDSVHGDATLPIAERDQNLLPGGFPRLYPRLEEVTLMGNARSDGLRRRNHLPKASDLIAESTPIVSRRSADSGVSECPSSDTTGISTLYARIGEGRGARGAGDAWTRRDEQQADTEKVEIWLKKKADRRTSRSSKGSDQTSGSGSDVGSKFAKLKYVPIVETGEEGPSWLPRTGREEEEEQRSGGEEQDGEGFLFLGKSPASLSQLPPEGKAACNARPSAPSPPSPQSVIEALLKRCHDSSKLRKGTSFPLPPGTPPSKHDRDSREVNRYRPFHRFARSTPLREKSTVLFARYVQDGKCSIIFVEFGPVNSY